MRVRVELTNMRVVFNALQETDKAAYRILVKEITDAAKKVQWAAATSTPDRPVSGWGPWNYRGRDLGFSPADVAAGFKVRKNNFKAYGIARGIGWDVVQTNPGGAVFEVVGDFSRVSTPSGAHLVQMINDRYGKPTKGTRILTKAYYKGLGDAEAFRERIAEMINDAARRAGLD
jgi:hypothetical protein